jgi:hypothetical protein
MNLAPPFSLFSAQISPLCCNITFLAIAKPTPVPSIAFVSTFDPYKIHQK